MRNSLLCLWTIAIGAVTSCFSLTACSSEDEGYQGAKLNKSLVESILKHTEDNKSRWGINNCGDYIAVWGRSSDDRLPGAVVPKGFVLLDEDGAVVCEREDIWFQNIGKFSNGLAAVINSPNWGFRMTEGMWGLINTKGEFVLPPEYDFIGSWEAGNAVVVKERQWGIINDEGEYVVPFGIYHALFCLDNGWAIAAKGNRFGMLNNSGKEVTPFEYEDVEYSDGLILFKKKSKWGILNKEAKELQPFQYDDIVSCAREGSGDLTILSKGDENCYFDNAGHQTTSDSESNVRIVKSDQSDGSMGAVDSQQNIVIPFNYSKIADNGLLYGYPKDDKQKGYDVFDKKGRKILTVESDSKLRIGGLTGLAYYYTTEDEGEPTAGLYSLETGERVIPHEYNSFTEVGNFITASYDETRTVDIFSRKGKKLYTITNQSYPFTKFLNGYYVAVEGNTVTTFFDNNGNHLFDIDAWFNIEENASNVISNQDNMKASILGIFSKLAKGEIMIGASASFSDIKSFGMKGPVKSVEDYALLNAKMSFDKESRLTAIDKYRIEYNNTTGTVVDGADVRRDNQGRILWVGKAGGCSGEIGYHFEYNDKGLTKWWLDEGDCTEMTVYEVQEYDDSKRPTSVKSTSTSKEEKTVADIEYSFERFDEWGNWISCEQTIDFTTTIIDPDDGSEHFGDSRVSTNKWKRIIRYYN